MVLKIMVFLTKYIELLFQFQITLQRVLKGKQTMNLNNSFTFQKVLVEK